MTRLSNVVFGVFSVVTLLAGATLVGFGIYFGRNGATECDTILRTPALVLGAAFMVLSLAGIAGACCRSSCLLWLYLFVMLLVILAMIVFTVFGIVVTKPGAGQTVSGVGFQEYHLQDYSVWLRNQVADAGNWAKISSCLQQSNVCGAMMKNNETYTQFVNSNLSPIESGCCKPPLDCNFTYQSETVWIKPATAADNTSDPDCGLWSNNQTSFCFSCASCKGGVLATLQDNWTKIAIAGAAFIVFLIVVYIIGCCALRNNRRNRYYEVGKGSAP